MVYTATNRDGTVRLEAEDGTRVRISGPGAVGFRDGVGYEIKIDCVSPPPSKPVSSPPAAVHTAMSRSKK
jgi:hypothetical protein